jgi:hypothetical protein
LLYQRQHGTGRRPDQRSIERAARRVGLQALTVKEATARLEALAAKRAVIPATPAGLLSTMNGDGTARRAIEATEG